MVSTSNRWLTTIWKASPALISSTAAETAAWNSSGVRCRRIGASRSKRGRDHRGRGRLGEPRGHRLDPGDGVGVRLVDALVAVVEVDRVGDQPDLAVVVVEHRQVGDQQEHQLGDVQVVGVAVGQPLDPADDVVAEVADQAGGERRQPVAAGCAAAAGSRAPPRADRRRRAGRPGRARSRPPRRRARSGWRRRGRR